MRKSLFVRVVLPLFIAMLLAPSSWGWIGTGHKVIALIAWEDLTPKTKATISELLRQHPRYEKDLLLDAPADATPDQLAKYAFATAATWPDMVRLQNHPMHNAYNHAPWHYIDIPFEDGVQAPPPPAPKESGPRDLVEALNQCAAELKNPEASAEKKSLDVCWVAHLVGDVHQPLHTASHYSAQFPKGDAGGNAAAVLRDPPYPDSKTNLHLLWDSLPGNFQSDFLDQYLATGLRADPQFSREALKSSLGTIDFLTWAKDSHALAVEDAYLNGKLEVAIAPRKGAPPSTQPVPGLPPGYMEKAERVAMRQVALSGYRLADLLNSLLDAKP